MRQWLIYVIPATSEVAIRRVVVVQSQPGQQVSKIPSQQNKPSMVVHYCDLSYTGGHRKTTV
jgi:hypothetical protein